LDGCARVGFRNGLSRDWRVDSRLVVRRPKRPDKPMGFGESVGGRKRPPQTEARADGPKSVMSRWSIGSAPFTRYAAMKGRWRVGVGALAARDRDGLREIGAEVIVRGAC